MTREFSDEEIPSPAACRVREIDGASSIEVELVASRMRQTLVEVLGEERGGSMYTMEWYRERVLWHLDTERRLAKVFVSLNCPEATAGTPAPCERITGQAIARIEQEESGEAYGFFATIFVEPESRRRGVAARLLSHVEEWFVGQRMPRMVYYTATTNEKLVRIFIRHGFRLVATYEKEQMVRLEKDLPEGLRLETPRLVIRLWRESDLDEFVRLCHQDGFNEFSLGRYKDMDRERARRFFEDEAGRFAKNRVARFGVFRKSDQLPVGISGIFEMAGEFEGSFEINYRYPREHWGAGYGSEAAGAVVRYALETLGLPWVYGAADPANTRSQKVLAKLGMSYFKEFLYKGKQLQLWRIVKG